jgi:hypothetical protein
VKFGVIIFRDKSAIEDMIFYRENQSIKQQSILQSSERMPMKGQHNHRFPGITEWTVEISGNYVPPGDMELQDLWKWC